jgi:hypothetical protein
MATNRTPSKLVIASWVALLVSALAIIQPVVPLGGVGEAVCSALGATGAALVLAKALHLEEFLGRRKAESSEPDRVISDLVRCATAVRSRGQPALAISKDRNIHPEIMFGMGLIATGADAALVRVAMERRLDAAESTLWPGPVLSRIIGAGAMFAGSAGLMLVQPAAAAVSPAWLFVLAGCMAGGMTLMAASHLIEGMVSAPGQNDGLLDRLLIEGITAIAAGRDPSQLEGDLRRIAGGSEPEGRPLRRAA